MILLVGPSASGKTEIAKELKKSFGITKAITTTTRSPRVGEVNGVDYFFVSKDEFLSLKEKDWFVETTFYNGNYYGCGKNQIDDSKAVVLDPNGLQNFINLNNPRIISFYIECSEKERKERMIQRGDGEAKANERIKNDQTAFINVKNKTDFVVTNESVTLNAVASSILILYKNKLAELN